MSPYYGDSAGVPAYGVWHSDDPDITIDIVTHGFDYYGTYVKNGESLPIYINFYRSEIKFAIHIINTDDSVGYINEYGPEYFVGKYKVKKDGKLYFELLPHYRERTGYDTIIFDKIKSYD